VVLDSRLWPFETSREVAMSGVEALAVVSIIANIFQLIDFSVNIYERAKTYGQGASEIPKAFRSTRAMLSLVRNCLEHTQERIDSGELDERHCKELGETLTGCATTIHELGEIFEKVLPAEGASTWARGRKAIASLGQDKKVEDLGNALMRFVSALTLSYSSRGLSTAQFTQGLLSLVPKPNQNEDQVQKPVFMVRHEKEACFIGREDIMKEISDRFAQKISRVAIAGIGGVGY
jgi:hypothetical protein